MINIEEAKKNILDETGILHPEDVEILFSLDRILAEDIYSSTDLSPFDNSAMDGYALLAEDTKGASEAAPVSLEIIEDIQAGQIGQNMITSGNAVKIMTGAPVPDTANAVIKKEDTEKEGNCRRVKIFKEVKKGKNIRRKGEDVKSGDLVIPEGKLIRPQEIGMLAALGFSSVKVIKKPGVAILATGNELIEIDAEITPGKIRNSNSYILYSLVEKYGGLPKEFGIARDNKEDIHAKLETIFKDVAECDVLIISGGVSVGSYDFVKETLQEAGFIENFWKVSIKPGKPVLFGKIGETAVFGLPGNPGSCIVTFEELVGPAIIKMTGRKEFKKKNIIAVCEEDITNSSGCRLYVRVKVIKKDNEFYVRSSGSQSSAVLKTFIDADGLLPIPAEIKKFEKGKKVTVELF